MATGGGVGGGGGDTCSVHYVYSMTSERYINLYRMIQKGEHEIDCKKKCTSHILLMISLQKIDISKSYIIPTTHTLYKLTGVLAKQVSPPPQSLGAPLGQGR